MKRLLKFAFVLVVLLIVAAVAAYIYLDQITKSAIERGGTYALGVETTVEGATLGIFSGELGISGLTIANPANFSEERFINLGEGDLAVSIASLREDVIEVPRLHLHDLEMLLERRGGKSNYEPILEALRRFETEPKPDAKRFIIRELLIENVVVHIDLLRDLPLGDVSGGGGLSGGAIDLPIDEIRLQDVGSDSDRGVLLTELFDIVIKAVLDVAIREGGDFIPTDIVTDLQGRLAQLEDLDDLGITLLSTVTADLDSIRKEFEERLGGDIGTIGDGLGGLLGGDDEDKEDDEVERRRRRNRDDQ